MTEPASAAAALRRTPLHAEHVALGARMVPFAGYEMPVQYPPGVLAEHNHARNAAGLFDVSHMGQAFLVAKDHPSAAAAVEALCPGEILGLGLGAIRYSMLLNDAGGIIDDLMVTRPVDPGADGRLFLVVNAARKDVDYTHIRMRLPEGVRLDDVEDRALLALQGPKAAEVMARHCPTAAALGFMTATGAAFAGIDCHVGRSGYTGEDGFEISVAASRAVELWRILLGEAEVKPVGLGARDSLRLEAGLCLYGHDIDETTSPVEADLVWAIGKRRREAGGFPGAERIRSELAAGAVRRRVGIRPEGRAPAREGADVQGADGSTIGALTSGGFGPTVGGPVAMGYVRSGFHAPGTPLGVVVRGRPLAAQVAALPFVPHRYVRRKPGGIGGR